MMTVAQKVPFELVALDGPAGGFTDSFEVAAALAEAIQGIAGLDRARLLVFGGWESASRGAGATMQMVGERLGIVDQFQGVDELSVAEDGSLRILERVDGGEHQVSACAGPPAVLGWATGNLPEPPNNPQVGMANMRTIMPALQRAKPVKLGADGLEFRERQGAQPAARDEDRQGPPGRRNRAGDRGLDQRTGKRERIMETILLLAHVEADGSLAKPALEALAAAKTIQEALEGASLVVGLGGRGGGCRGPPGGLVRRQPLAGRRGSRVRAAALCDRRRRRRGPVRAPPAPR